MRKKLVLIPAVMLCAALILGGCGSEKLTMIVDIAEDGKSCNITADKADENGMTMSGSLIIGENDKIIITQEFEEGGELLVQFIPQSEALQDAEAGLSELEGAVDASNSVLDAIVSGPDAAEYYLAAGEYYLNVTPQSKTTGTATIVVEEAEPFSAWQSAASAEEAAAAVGMDTFEVPNGVTIGLGEIQVESYHYQDNVVMANIPFPAVQMYVIKGTPDREDVSEDYAEYVNTWTQDVDGQEVTCFGNREGEATKTIWTTDAASYAVTAYGLGGDTDFGLSAEDVAAVVSGTK